MRNYINYPDLKQRELVKSLLNVNMSIEAGAGAGKSTIIVDRIINQLASGVMPSELVAITFTKAATEELRGRIIAKLANVIKEEKDSTRRNILVDAFNNLYSMNISTIHSFCNKMLTERCFEANLPIGVSLLEDDKLEEQMKNIFNIWFKNISKDQWSELYRYENRKNVIKNIIYDLYVKLINSGEELNVIRPDIERLSTIFKDIKESLHPLYDYLYECLNMDKKYDIELKSNGLFYNDLVLLYEDDIDAIYKNDKEKYSYFLKVLKGIKGSDFIKGSRKAIYKDDLENLKEKGIELYEEIKDEVSILLYKLESYKYDNYIVCATNAYKFYLANKDSKSLTNNELITKALELVNNKAARDYFASKYKCIYVDEFQDTDITQASLIWKICEKKDKPGELRDGALFVVGDPKQSIYRFRGAEPEVYFKIREDIASLDNGEIFFFSYNFRSNNEIIDKVNSYYNEKDKPLIMEGNYQNMEFVDAHKVPDSTNIDSICLSGVYEAIHNFNKEAFKDNDPLKVASLIKELVSGKYAIPKRNELDPYGPYVYKQVTYSDILVIVGKHSGMKDYVNAFNTFKIPCIVTGEVSVNDETIVSIYLAILKGLICFNDSLAVVGAKEAIRANNTYLPSNVVKEKDIDNYYDELFNDLKDKTNNMSCYGKAIYLLKHPEWYIPKDRKIKSNEYLSIQTKLEQMIEVNFKDNYVNGIEMLSILNNYVETSLKCELSLIKNDSIRIMNVHNSKGLEGEIVIWGNLDVTREFRFDGYKVGNDYYPSLTDGNRFPHLSYCGYFDKKEIVDKAMTNEELEIARLEYVGITRAKQVFIFMDVLSDNTLFNRKEKYDYHRDSLRKIYYDIKDEQDFDEEEVTNYQMLKDNSIISSNKNIYKLSPSSLDNLKSTIREEYKKDLSYEQIIDSLKNRPVGAIIGTIMHRALELVINRFNCLNDNVIKASINQAINENIEDIEDIKSCEVFLDVIVNKYVEYMKEHKYLENVKEIHCELPYSFYDENSSINVKDNKDNLPIYLNGTMDLLIIYNDNKALIIDYKSDAAEYILNEEVFKDTLKEKYSEQLNLYKKSLVKIYDIKEENIESKIIYFRHFDSDLKNVIVLEKTI